MFASDIGVKSPAFASLVTSRIACGRILDFDLASARRVRGLLGIFTYQEFAGKIQPVPHLMAGGYANSSALPLGSAEIRHEGQIVALIVAETFEASQEAAAKVVVNYQTQPASFTLESKGVKSVPLAEIRKGYKDPATPASAVPDGNAHAFLDAVYSTPIQHHNAIELFTTTCVWNGGQLTVFESTRYIGAVQHGLAAQLGLDPAAVRVICPYIGGHFGSRLALSQHTAIVALAARQLNRAVKLAPTRSQCFTIANHRPDTRHTIRIAAGADGKFQAFSHSADVTSSRFDNFAMEGTDVTSALYGWGKVTTKESVVRVDRNTPGPMRAPPEVPYLFAVESAVDELAIQLKTDPIELRRRNDTDVDPVNGKRFERRLLMRCFDRGAEAFEWSRRNPEPRSMREGEWLIGLGCASAVRPAKSAPATLRLTLTSSGTAEVAAAHHEIGNGIYTVLALEASQRLCIDVAKVLVRLGDSALPAACLSGGSSTTASLVPAIAKACELLRDRLAEALHSDRDSLRFVDGGVTAPALGTLSLKEAVSRTGEGQISVMAETIPLGSKTEALASVKDGKIALGDPGAALKWAYGAQFAEVHVHPVTCEIRVARLTGAFAAGHIVNRLTALSQMKGGMVWGMSAALLEATEVDERTGHYMNDNLSDYLVPTAADVPRVEAIIADEEGNPIDLIGVGEIGIIGMNAAIANAIHHATGHRFRRLPIRVEDILKAELNNT